MKKFIVLSILVALGAITVGVIRRHESRPTTAVTAAEVTTTTIAPTATSSTTAAPQAAKVAAKTTATTARRATSPTTAALAPATTTSTTFRPATTTTTTARATTTIGPAPTCTVAADNPSVTYNDSQVIRLASNMPNTPVTVVMVYPKATANGYPQQFNHRVTTDGGGADVWSFKSTTMTAGTVTISVSISPPGRTMSNVCRTTFQSKAL